MRELLSRLRAVLTPQALWLLAAMLMLGFGASHARQEGTASLEKRISRTLSAMEGAGRVEVTIREREIQASGGAFTSEKKEGVPCGAVAVAQGAGDPLVAMQLQGALCALLGLPPASVSIVTGGK